MNLEISKNKMFLYENVIRSNQTPSTHPGLPWPIEKGLFYVIMLYLLVYKCL